jgi:uncharacterized membrane protein
VGESSPDHSDVSPPVAAPQQATSALSSDGLRAFIATVVAFLVPILVGIVLSLTPPPGTGGIATTIVLWLIGWNTFVVAYVILTFRTFNRVDAEQFRARMVRRGAKRSWIWRMLAPGGDGPTWAVESALVAFVVVLVLPHVSAIDINDWILVPVTFSILLSCWALSVVSYALHYAQYDIEQPGLDFPGDRTHAFADYMYFSIAVATTFGATDVNITTPHMRRVVNLHTVLTFIYNSVIVALLAALLIR